MLNGIAQLLGASYHGETPTTERQIGCKIESLLAENERLRFAAADRECDVTNLTARAEAAEADAAKCRDEYKSLYAQVSAVMRERDDARQAAIDLAKKVGIEKVLAAETARADEASQLLRAVSAIINPHDPYDPAKLLGWARDTVERAREADVALAHADDLRGALDTLNHAAKVAISTRYGGNFDEDTPLVIRLLDGTCDETDAALSRTPAQSLGKLKAGVLREAAELIGPKYGEGQARWALLAEANELEATDANKG